MTPPVRRALATAAVLTLALVMVGCQDDPTAAPATDVTATTPSPTSGTSPGAASTSPPTSTATTAVPDPTTGPRGPEPITAAKLARVVAQGFDDTAGARLDIDNGLGYLDASGVADFRSTPTALDLGLVSVESDDAPRIGIRIVGGTLYLATGKRWGSTAVDGPGSPLGPSLTAQLDPRGALAAVVDAMTGATRQGGVEQGGERLVVYRVQADGAAVTQALAPDLGSREGSVIGGGVPDEVTADLGIDGDGHVRSLSIDLGADNGRIVYTLDGWSTGDDVSVAAPPAAQVDEGIRVAG